MYESEVLQALLGIKSEDIQNNSHDISVWMWDLKHPFTRSSKIYRRNLIIIIVIFLFHTSKNITECTERQIRDIKNKVQSNIRETKTRQNSFK